MPRLSQVMGEQARTTWGDAVEKGSLGDTPFWIHNARVSEYTNEKGDDVSLLVLDITINGPSRHDPRAVITVGNTEERAGLLAYFSDDSVQHDPLGPCVTFEVPLKGGRSFWRLEDAPEEDAPKRASK